MTPPKKTGVFEKDAYILLLEAARERRAATQMQLLEWVTRLGELAESEFINLESLTDIFPHTKGRDTFRLVYDIHLTAKRYGTVGISLRTDRMRVDLMKVSTAELGKLLKPHCSPLELKDHVRSLLRFRRFNEQVAALSFLGVKFEVLGSKGSVLPRWFASLGVYGQKCRTPLERVFDDFAAQSALLDEAMFEFNGTMGRVRFRAIRCSYTVDEFDLLGPSNPALKVVVSLNPVAGQRRYNLMADFKKALKRKRFGKQLKRELGREANKSEIDDAIRALRPRKETDWITKDVIKACYLGRSIKDVFEAQKNLVAVMQPWANTRAHLQALLP